MSIKADIERFIVDRMDGPREIEPEESLFEAQVLDSLAFLQLLRFIESKYSINVQDDEVVTENFETLTRIEEFVARKIQGG